MSVHKIFIFLLPCFVIIAFFFNFWRFDQFYEVFSPDNNNKKVKEEKKKQKTKTKTLNPWIDLVNFSETRKKTNGSLSITQPIIEYRWCYFCLKIIHFSSCYFSSLFIFILLIHYSSCSEPITGHCDKTKILNSTIMTIIYFVRCSEVGGTA